MSESTTLRLHDRDRFRRAVKQLEVEYNEILNADTTDVHEAIVRVGLVNPDLLLRKLEEVHEDE